MENKVKLMPCPFCGGEATIAVRMPLRTTYYSVTCTRCNLHLLGEPPFRKKEDAVLAWNTRQPTFPVFETDKGEIDGEEN